MRWVFALFSCFFLSLLGCFFFFLSFSFPFFPFRKVSLTRLSSLLSFLSFLFSFLFLSRLSLIFSFLLPLSFLSLSLSPFFSLLYASHTQLVCSAICALVESLVLGQDLESMFSNMGATWTRLVGDPQLRWCVSLPPPSFPHSLFAHV